MPKPVKSAAVLRLEEKQAKLRKLDRSLKKQLAKQRQEDKNARQKLKRDVLAAQEKAIERQAFDDLTVLANSSVEDSQTIVGREVFGMHKAVKHRKLDVRIPKGKEFDVTDTAELELVDVVGAIKECSEQKIKDVLDDAYDFIMETATLLPKEDESGDSMSMFDKPGSSKQLTGHV